MKTQLETITPAIAEKYLKSNTTNRPVRWRHVDSLKHEILTGRWLTTHQGIAFGSDGGLIDGQHRLLAIQAAGRAVQMLVTRGVESKLGDEVKLHAMDVIDNGQTRSAADQLHLMHGTNNASVSVAALRVIVAVLCPSARKISLTVSRAVPLLEIYGKEIESLIKLAGSSKVGRKSAVIGILAIASKIDEVLAQVFMAAYSTGEDINSGDPVYALREHVISKGVGSSRGERDWFSEAVANCFLNTLKGNSIRVMKGGAAGLDFLRSKQRDNAERIRAIIFGG